MVDTRKRQRSATPPHKPQKSDSGSGSSADTVTTAHTVVGGWEKLENGSVLLLPPTPSTVQHLIHTQRENHHSTDLSHVTRYVMKMAAFDLDDTLIRPASGGVFAKDGDPSDWQFLHPHVSSHLQHLHRHGFLLCVLSNQSGIGKGKGWNEQKARVIEAKIQQVRDALGVPLCAAVATRDDTWRKPSPRIWTNILEPHVRQCVEEVVFAGKNKGREETPQQPCVDVEAYSFYVGDAAGRSIVTLAGRKKDFSCSDRQFAYNVQLPFFTPEQFFLHPKEKLLQEDPLTHRWVDDTASPVDSRPAYRLSDAVIQQLRLSSQQTENEKGSSTGDVFSWGDVSPDELRAFPTTYAGLPVSVLTPTRHETVTLPPGPPFFPAPGHQEMILLVGFPGCGKTSFYERHFQPQGYVRVNRDALQTKAKCLKAAKEAWAAGHSVVIDNTNPTAEDRQAFVNIVKASQNTPKKKLTDLSEALPVRLFVFGHTRGLANHMNWVRAQVKGVPRVPTIAYNVYQSRLQPPPTTVDEVAALQIAGVWEIPPVASFEGAPPQTEKLFYLLS